MLILGDGTIELTLHLDDDGRDCPIKMGLTLSHARAIRDALARAITLHEAAQN